MEQEGNAANNQTSVPVSVSEQNGMMTAETSDKKKTGNGMLIGMILCALIAVCGIGFGVWAMIDGNVQKEQLNSQISTLKSQNNELKDKIEIANESSSSTNSNEDVNSADYIYIGEWGIKIRMPESLSVINYSLSDSDAYGEHLAVSGAKEKVNGVTPKYAHLDMCSGSIVRSNSDDGFYPYGVLVYTDSVGKKYYYEGPNGIPDLPEEDYRLWEEVKEVLKKSLTNPDNFSEI